ncbi:uncharacterized protein LOC114358189 isoform X1 [Ostrinia furnacalis]|uniref:uncharacterized protein LOC114358189 isoform X1 n=1 Tax=Ostrinia furnacalis TaxID=93504 RepID=UPI00103B3653|nr:uncharacterized protein LOC114358189 isoform X1 [Ostrinia furnacalis]
MAQQSQFSLAWDEYRRNICNGLSSLQQNGEFVDMTLAADGHFVKVHQVIVALASPYLKELIASIQCPHPVVFLNVNFLFLSFGLCQFVLGLYAFVEKMLISVNCLLQKISYTTLCSVLEYIYTGEVLVSVDHLNELIDAGRELHIRGLEDMKLQQQLPKSQELYANSQTSNNVGEYDEEVCYFEISNQRSEDDQSQLELQTSMYPEVYDSDMKPEITEKYDNSMLHNFEQEFVDDGVAEEITPDSPMTPSSEISQKNPGVSIMQYTVSNQGSLQMILNRFVYYLKHSNASGTRQWRCVDYVSAVKCPAHIVTKADMVLQRIHAHTHPFHDKRILKKVRAGSIFSAIQEAENQGKAFKRKRMNSPAESSINSADINPADIE